MEKNVSKMRKIFWRATTPNLYIKKSGEKGEGESIPSQKLWIFH